MGWRRPPPFYHSTWEVLFWAYRSCRFPALGLPFWVLPACSILPFAWECIHHSVQHTYRVRLQSCDTFHFCLPASATTDAIGPTCHRCILPCSLFLPPSGRATFVTVILHSTPPFPCILPPFYRQASACCSTSTGLPPQNLFSGVPLFHLGDSTCSPFSGRPCLGTCISGSCSTIHSGGPGCSTCTFTACLEFIHLFCLDTPACLGLFWS